MYDSIAIGIIGFAGLIFLAIWSIPFFHWVNNWGTTEDEQKMSIPGDQIVGHQKIKCTHAINIKAPANQVWPWIAQIGQGRGGFYSYSWLENLFGAKIKNVNRVVPELQDLKVGDKVALHPKAPPLTVQYLEKNKVLALEGWFFYLMPSEADKTRLIVRAYDWRSAKPSFMDKILGGFIFDLAHFIMERKMIVTIKKLAEERTNLERQIA